MREWSEKARYSDLLKEKVPCSDAGIFIWGEELYDRKLVGKICRIDQRDRKEMEERQGCLENVD